VLTHLLRDGRGASVAEYALVLALIAAPIALAMAMFGAPIRAEGLIQNVGPDGVVHRCLTRCQYEYKDYCAAVSHKNDAEPPTFSPAITGTCNGETPLS
jgi:Flp pilus assembly pilin Flp